MQAPAPSRITLGWDIGGSNTKVAAVSDGRIRGVRSAPLEFATHADGLVALLTRLAAEVVAGVGLPPGAGAASHAVTMTAELSRVFRTKRDGVGFVLDAVHQAFGTARVAVFAVDGRWLTPEAARAAPLAVAASNWAATAAIVAARRPDAILIDVGTTTTDLVPIADGVVRAAGWTDPDRLACGELVYTGAVRTPVEALSSEVTVRGARIALAAEGFACAGDVHVWRGDLDPADVQGDAPDGRGMGRDAAGHRLARAVCADREMLDDAAVHEIAGALAAAQIDRVAGALARVRVRAPGSRTAVVTGLGAFIAARVARAGGLAVVSLADVLGDEPGRAAPAAAVALLRDAALRDDAMPAVRPPARGRIASGTADVRAGVRSTPLDAHVDAVVKIGGSLLRHPDALAAVLATVRAAAGTQRLALVPGGGAMADAVRDVDRRLGLSDDAAHWMAVLAMDQHAHLLVDRLSGGTLVRGRGGTRRALVRGEIPVLAPYRWLRRVDPLPHTWAVTGDSIAAWIAGALDARRLVLVKAPGTPESDAVDETFSRVVPPRALVAIVPADEIDRLAGVLGASASASAG